MKQGISGLRVSQDVFGQRARDSDLTTIPIATIEQISEYLTVFATTSSPSYNRVYAARNETIQALAKKLDTCLAACPYCQYIVTKPKNGSIHCHKCRKLTDQCWQEVSCEALSAISCTGSRRHRHFCHIPVYELPRCTPESKNNASCQDWK